MKEAGRSGTSVRAAGKNRRGVQGRDAEKLRVSFTGGGGGEVPATDSRAIGWGSSETSPAEKTVGPQR